MAGDMNRAEDSSDAHWGFKKGNETTSFSYILVR